LGSSSLLSANEPRRVTIESTGEIDDMTLEQSVAAFAELSVNKKEYLAKNPLGFWVSSLMAGAYVGLGILLIFSVGQTADPSVRNLVMGVSFGIALTLVIFAGSELFTGHTMYMTIGKLTGCIQYGDVFRAWGVTWTGNLVGCIILGAIFVAAGGGAVLQDSGNALIHAVATKKMSAPGIELFFRAMLCNWLVCLAIWGASRTANDTAKCVIIFWCLFAFISAGFEHSVANMTLFSVALLSEHPDTVTYAGALRNLFWVTLGNTASGTIFMGLGYWIAAGRPTLGDQSKVDASTTPGE
jgi:nitrite transporter NirC